MYLHGRCTMTDSTETLYDQTIINSKELQDKMVSSLSMIMVAVVFGPVAPLLALASPLAIWLNLNALRWENKHKPVTIGESLAANFFVQQPWTTCFWLTHIGQWTICVCLFIDYGCCAYHSCASHTWLGCCLLLSKAVCCSLHAYHPLAACHARIK